MLTPTILPPIWNVPYKRNPFFTGGEELLSRLQMDLQKEGAAALSQPQGISGLGGIGKTQLALEYAYCYHTYYTAVLWVPADSASTLTSGFLAVAHLLGLPERDEQDERVIVEAVMRWLRQQVGWLLVLDNVEDLAVVESFVPKARRGHVLLTTRSRSLGALAHRIEVQKMEPETGALFLLRRASLLLQQDSLEAVSNEERMIASTISQVLDGLPLALDQAGAYIKETSFGLQKYLELYQIRRKELLRFRDSFEEDYPASVATTWSLSFEKVAQANPASAELLDLCAFLSPDAIPEEMIAGGASHLGPLLQPVAADPLLFDQSIAVLHAYSLIARNADDSVLSIHRLVQAVLRDSMAAEEEKQWMRQVVLAVNAVFPEVEFAQWSACERCVPHALLCANWIEQEHMTFPEAARLLNQAGDYLTERGRYPEAEPLLKCTLVIHEQQLGSEHPDTATGLHNLAELYRNQGKFEEAAPLYQRALAIQEQVLDPYHPDIAESLNNLGILYRTFGRYTEAEHLYLRALAINERALGPQHLHFASSLNNLATLYFAQGRYVEAQSLYQQVLEIREQQSDPQHPLTARILHNLAGIYYAQGKYAEAERTYWQALTIYKQVLDPQDPYTASCIDGLGALYRDQGQYEKAESLLLHALANREQRLGPDHRDIAISLNNLAVLYHAQGQYEKAEPLLLRALKIQEQRLGHENPETARSLNNLAKLHHAQRQYEKAESLFQRSLEIREQQLGPNHRDTAISLDGLALLYLDWGKYLEAEPLFQRSLLICEQQLGHEHPITVGVKDNCQRLLQTMGQNTEAIPPETGCVAKTLGEPQWT